MYASGGVRSRWPGGVGGVPSPPRFLANRRSKGTHSLRRPCRYAGRIAPHNRLQTLRRPAGYSWCDLCFPHLADG